LGDAPNFNVGIIDPIVLPGLANCFKVRCRTALGAEVGIIVAIAIILLTNA
jgi:hypothetical protein